MVIWSETSQFIREQHIRLFGSHKVLEACFPLFVQAPAHTGTHISLHSNPLSTVHKNTLKLNASHPQVDIR